MKRFVLAISLTVAISSSVLAGDIPTDGSPAPVPSASGQIPTVPGEVPTVGMADQISSDAWSALLSMLGFLAV